MRFKNFIKCACLLVCISFYTGLSYGAYATKKPELVVFIVHGFKGDPGDFCDLKNVLENSFDGALHVEYIRYATRGKPGVSSNHPMHKNNISLDFFAEDVASKMANVYARENINENTPATVITHSQGSLILQKILFDCRYNKASYCPQNKAKTAPSLIPSNIKQLFSIMAPYHGSSISSRIKDMGITKPFFPNQQIRDLATGGAFINYNRNLSLPLSIKKDKDFKSIDFINISANAKPSWLTNLMTLLWQVPENGSLESDMAVSLPSARMDFIYYNYKDLQKPYAHQTNISDYYYNFKGDHSSIPMTTTEGLACVDWQARSKSPFLAILYKHIGRYLKYETLGYEHMFKPDAKVFSPNIASFQLEVRIYFPDQYLNKKLKKEMIKWSIPANEKNKILYMPRKNNLVNKYSGFNYDTWDKGYVTYYTEGAFKKAYAYKVEKNFKANKSQIERQRLKLEINIPGYRKQIMEVSISPSYNTLVDIKLVK